MSRIEARFAELKTRNRCALIPFVTAGDPEPGLSVPIMHALVAAGADLLELGVPFSDPMADGPVIQRASERALGKGINLRVIFELVSDFRTNDAHTPVVLMGYANPIEVYGYEAFAEDAARAGVDGVLTVDLPPEEAVDWGPMLRSRGIDPIYLLAPTSDESRIALICSKASGFVYYVSLRGVTGAASLDAADAGARVKAIKQLTDLPVGVGFGIRDGDSAARIARVSDAVVVGSVLVQRIESLLDDPQRVPDAVAAIVAEMRCAMDAGASPARESSAPATGSST